MSLILKYLKGSITLRQYGYTGVILAPATAFLPCLVLYQKMCVQCFRGASEGNLS